MPYPENRWSDNNGCFWLLFILAVVAGCLCGILALIYCVGSLLLGVA